MSIWRASTTPEALTERGSRSLSGYLGIRITEIGPDFLRATMPVNEHTHQPFGVLHGGASVALAETVGSLASMMCVDLQQSLCLGQEINANHLRAVSAGTVTATGPAPGPPPPCGVEKVLCRLSCTMSAPMCPGFATPISAFMLAPSR